MTILRRALWRDLRARRAQFVAVGATILLGVALFGASYDAFQNLTASYRAMYDELAFADLTVTGGPADRIAADGAAVPEVVATTTRSVGDVPVRIGSHAQLARIVGLPPDGMPAVNRVMVLRGRNLDPGHPDEVLAEQHLASAHGLEPGATLSVLAASGWRTVTVVGIVASPEYLWPARSRQEFLTPSDQWGVLFGPASLVAALPPGAVHAETLFRLSPDAPGGTVDRLAAIAIADGATSTQTQEEQPSNATLQEDVNGFGELSIAFPVMFLLAGALAMSVLLGRMVASQRAQIGVMLASGFERRTILGHYLGFGLLVGLAGSIPGAILGGLAAAAISRLYTATIAVPITVIEVRPLTIVTGLVIGPLAGALAAYVPARRAARTSPAAAMRGAAPVGRGGISLAERLVPLLRSLPTRWRVALRGLGRSPRRTLSTIIGIAIATTLVLVSWGMIDTTQILLDRQFLGVQRQDATAYFASPLAASRVEAALAADGVAAVEPQLTVSGAVVRGDERYATTLVGLVSGTTMHGFATSDGRPLALPADGLLLGAALRDQLGIEVGDVVQVDVGVAAVTSLPVAGFTDEPLGTYAYGTIETIAGLAGQPPDRPAVSSALIRYDAGADRAAVADRLAALPAVAAVLDNQALYAMAQSLMGLFYAFVGIMLVFGAVMAFALIFNTMTANVAERATELAALRTLGMARGTVSRLITAENVLLTLAGLVPGLVGGYVMAAAFMASFSSDLFSFDLHVRPTTFLFTALAILVVAVVSQWPALRSVGRIDLGRIIRERSM
ncbi:MAG: ABC transporter permease [Chloroflexota bacterium]